MRMQHHMPNQPARGRRGQRGAALIVAISLLAIFTVFGTWFIGHMSVELNEANVDLRETRARLLAEAGVRAAALELRQALAADALDALEMRGTLSLPTYEMTFEGAGQRGLSERTESAATATYVIEDENAKLNLNHAPVSAIADVLGLQRHQVLKIPANLPHSNGEGAWLGHLDDLRTRDLLGAAQFAGLPRDLVTVSTVLDNDNPEPHINVERAPARVAEAVEGSPVMADAITTGSNTFRITCEGLYQSGGERWKATAYAEALVRFEDGGTYRVLEWRTEGVELPAGQVADTGTAESDEDGA